MRALFHLLTVESLSFYTATWTSLSIFTQAIRVLQSREFSRQTDVVTGIPSLPKALRQAMDQISSFLPKLSSEVGLAHMIFMIPLAMPMVVLALTLWRFKKSGCPKSAGSGRYLAFTWQLERWCVYRGSVFLMAVVPTLVILAMGAIPLMMCVEGEDSCASEDFGIELRFLHDYLFKYLVFLYSLKTMAFPLVVHSDWNSPEFKCLEFNRSCKSLMKSNDAFCVFLTKALFQARCGERDKPLHDLCACRDAAHVLAVCQQAEAIAAQEEGMGKEETRWFLGR